MHFAEQLRQDGYAVVEGVLDDEAVRRCIEALAAVPSNDVRRVIG
jgi:hypothetical protein